MCAAFLIIAYESLSVKRWLSTSHRHGCGVILINLSQSAVWVCWSGSCTTPSTVHPSIIKGVSHHRSILNISADPTIRETNTHSLASAEISALRGRPTPLPGISPLKRSGRTESLFRLISEYGQPTALKHRSCSSGAALYLVIKVLIHTFTN